MIERRIARVRGEPVLQFVAFAAPDGALQRGQILAEALQQFEHGLAVGQKDVAPHDRIGGGDAGKVAKTAGRIGDDLGLQILAEFGRGADDRIGDQMRQMRGDRQHLVVVIGRHRRDPHSGQFPQRFTLASASGSVSGSGVRMHQRSRNSSAKPDSGPECSVPATGWPGTKCDTVRQRREQRLDRGALDRADIGDDRAVAQAPERCGAPTPS